MFKPLLKHVVLASALLVGIGSVSAIELKPGHPVEYVVKKGDTLWDLSQKFLQDAWLWPEIWQLNEQIQNPHLIYPGDVIGLVYKGDQVKVTVKERNGQVQELEEEGGGLVKLKPSARISELNSAIPPIPISAIDSFMTNSRIVKSKQIKTAPYVVSGDDNRLLAGGGGKVYARGFGKKEPEAGYGIFRKGQMFVDPDTNEILGLEAREVGAGSIVAWDGDVATLSLSNAKEEVVIGDRLLATEDRQVVANFMPSAPPEGLYGRTIAVLGGVTQIGQLERLHKLSLGAEEAGQFSAAINAEKIRSALGGLTIDRRETINTIDQLSRDEITARLAALQKQYPQAFQIEADYKDVTPDEQGTRGELLEHDTEYSTEEVVRDSN